MNLHEIIDQEIKKAMMAKDKVRLEVLRSAKTAFMETTTAKGASHDLTEEQSVAILQRMVKQRKDSSAIYKEQNRSDLAEQELKEVEVLRSYLPEQLTQEELDKTIGDIIDKANASSLKDMGKVMGIATKSLAGKAQGRAIADTVKKLLS